MFMKKKKFSSGYFPSFITLDDNKYNLISQNTNPNNIKDNCYLKTKDNIYLKQIVNKNSRYNLEYFNNLRNACQDILNIDNQPDIINYTSNSNNSVNKINYTFNDSINKIVTPKIAYLSQVSNYLVPQVSNMNCKPPSLKGKPNYIRSSKKLDSISSHNKKKLSQEPQ